MPRNFVRSAALIGALAIAACSNAGAPLSSSITGMQGSGEHVIGVGGRLIQFGGPAHRSTHRSWISRDAAKRSLLYGSSYDGGFINIYDAKGNNQQPIGQLTSGLVSPEGLFVDKQHQLWVTNTNAFGVVAFKRGKTTPFTTLSDPDYYPVSVAVDKNGTVYAANAESTTGPPGNVTVWTKGSTSPTGTLTYSNFLIVLGVGVDAQNNVYVSYIPTSGPPSIVVFPAGSQTGTPLGIQDANEGDMTFDKHGNLVMETLSDNLGVWAPPYAGGPSRTISAFGNEPSLNKTESKVWIAYANYSQPMIEGYNYKNGNQVDVITNGWTSTAIPIGVAIDPRGGI
jgi:hypothetical protein